ncbi:spore coat assembly protein SafA [Barrientosiimonas marina]|uniref:SafA/ExsA family spore coat assembly protein n=1 Tax=Lentibacillus kimchii TaxID=1542911 RepID=UPI0036D3233B
MKIHIVQKGDTLWEIAQQYGVDFNELKQLNPQISSPDMIMPGMKIKIPASSKPVKNEGAQQKNVSKAEPKPAAEELYQDSSPKPMPFIQEDDSESPKEMKPKMPQKQSSMPAYPQMPSTSNVPHQSKAEAPSTSGKPAMPEHPSMSQHPAPPETNITPWPENMTQPHMPSQLHTQPIIYNMTYCFPQMPVYPQPQPQPQPQQGPYGMQSGMYHQPYQEMSYQNQQTPYPGSAMPPMNQHYGMQQQDCGCGGYQSMPMYQQPPNAQQPMPISQPMSQYPVNPNYSSYAGYMESSESSDMFEASTAPTPYPNMAGSGGYYSPAGMHQGYPNPQMPPAMYPDTGNQQYMPMPPGYGNMYRDDEEDWASE